MSFVLLFLFVDRLSLLHKIRYLLPGAERVREINVIKKLCLHKYLTLFFLPLRFAHNQIALAYFQIILVVDL